MNSFILTKQKPPKNWITPILWGLFDFFIIQVLFLVPIYITFEFFEYNPKIETIVLLFGFMYPLLGIFVINRYVNKRSIEALGFHKSKWLSKYGVGILIGTLLIALTCGGAFILGALKLELNTEADFLFLFVLMIGFMIQGMTEEVICRGYIQNGIRVRFGLVATMIVQAAFFAGMHMLNSSISLLAIFNLFLYGVFIGMVFYYTDSIWIVGGIHSVWNFLLGPILGIEVSGQVVKGTIFKATAIGSELLNGGKFGIEASILTTVFLCIGILIVYFLMKRDEK